MLDFSRKAITKYKEKADNMLLVRVEEDLQKLQIVKSWI
jgi:hypothetical protein